MKRGGLPFVVAVIAMAFILVMFYRYTPGSALPGVLTPIAATTEATAEVTAWEPVAKLTPIAATAEATALYRVTPMFLGGLGEPAPGALPDPAWIPVWGYEIWTGRYTSEELKGALFAQGYDLDAVTQVGETITASQAEKTKTADTRATRAAAWATLSAEGTPRPER